MQICTTALTIAADLYEKFKLAAHENLSTAKRKRDRDRRNPVTSHKPELPLGIDKTGKQGRIQGFASTLAVFVNRNLSFVR